MTHAVTFLIMFSFSLQTKINITEMESVQRHSAEVEGEDSIEQRNLAMLAHAV